MARAMWKGVIRFGSAEVPVKLYSAVQARSVHFRMLHESTKAPVQQRMVSTEADGEVVPHEEVRKGFEIEKGVIVMLDEEELASLEPEPSRDIEITRFVAHGQIDHQWYERPYFLGPDGDEEAYFALAEALGKQEKAGVARWVMRKKEYFGALRAEGDYLMLITLRPMEEVVSASALPAPSGRKLDVREMKMAEQLIGMLTAEFDPSDYRDEYRERVLELVNAKAKGGTIALHRAKPRKETDSLTSALEASIETVGKRRKIA